jgi:hypothetical protein
MRKLIFLIFILSASLGAFAQKSKKQRQAEKRARIDTLVRKE